MDNLTHGLTGAGIGLLLSQQVLGVVADPGLVVTAILASQVPDIDAIVGAKSKTQYLKHHRGISHSFLTAPFLAAATAAVMGIFFTTDFWLLMVCAVFSLALHIILDVFNAYGTKALWPVSQHRFAWDVLMVIDPVIIGMFSVGIGLYMVGYQIMLYMLYPFLCLYILIMMRHRLQAKKLLQRRLTPTKQEIALLPPMVGWRQWNFIVAKNEKYYIGRINIRNKQMNFVDVLDVPCGCAQVEQTKLDPNIQIFLDFARFPYFRKYQSDDGNVYVRWSDLRYRLREKEHFTLWSKAN